MLLKILLFLLSIFSLNSSIEADIVKSLPNYSYHGRLYSGYLSVSKVKQFHYMFNLAHEDWEHKPLVLWLNGGPGCSSLFGMLGEIGPVTADNYGGEFKLNPYSWNLESNLLLYTGFGEKLLSLQITQNCFLCNFIAIKGQI